jgi:hypothetical protein
MAAVRPSCRFHDISMSCQNLLNPNKFIYAYKCKYAIYLSIMNRVDNFVPHEPTKSVYDFVYAVVIIHRMHISGYFSIIGLPHLLSIFTAQPCSDLTVLVSESLAVLRACKSPTACIIE